MRLADRAYVSPFFSLKTSGTENIPERVPFVLLPKHQRWEDIPLLGLASPRPLYYVAKQELFGNPVSRWFLSALGGIPLNRRRPLASRRAIQAVIHFLAAGEGVVIFPEGTYYRGRMGPGQEGMVRLVLNRLSLPFIPVGIHYGDPVVRTPVRIVFGPPLYGDDASSPRDFVGRAMERIAELSGMI
jgi:1-acyl-sn-glycerol-3-phosphate acyltransferase